MNDLICYSQTANLASIEHTSLLISILIFLLILFLLLIFFMYRYFYYLHFFLENSSISSHYLFADIFVITWTITHSKKHHNLKTSAELFWVILLEFLYLLTAVNAVSKKVCKDVFCITPMLTALNFFSQ